MRPRRVGLVVNPLAGGGGGRALAAAAAALAALDPAEVLTGPAELGAAACESHRSHHPDLEFVVEAPAGSDAASGRATTRDLVVRAARFGAEAIVVVGGDGTLSDAATALHAAGADVPIIGVGAGSTNAGALVSVDHTSVDRLLQGELHDVNVAALSLVLPGGGRCLAFNDVVVGTTVCGTLDGGYVNLAAEPFMRGQRTLAEPEPLRARGAVIAKITSAGRAVLVAAGEAVGSVAIGFTRVGNVQGQALLGGLGLSSGAGVPAACLVATFPVVYAGLDLERHAAMEPLQSSYVGFSAGETVRLSGFSDGAVLIADGNPLLALVPEEVVEVSVLDAACRVLRPGSRS